jgi:hypothetical protein
VSTGDPVSVETMGPPIATGSPVVDLVAYKRDRHAKHRRRHIVFAVCVVLAFMLLLEAA